MRSEVRRLLAKYGYPPDNEQRGVEQGSGSSRFTSPTGFWVHDLRMAPAPSDVDLVVASATTNLPSEWPQWGGGWPGEIEAALLDAVLSIRSRYGKKSTTGVRGAVGRYRDHRGAPLDDLTALAAIDPAELQTVLRNRQKTGRVTKAEALVAAAAALSAVGVTRLHTFDPFVPTSVPPGCPWPPCGRRRSGWW